MNDSLFAVFAEKLKATASTQLKLLVVGDVMLDRYWRGTTKRISPEAPVPVVNIQQDDARPGGAGNVALNLASLGAQTDLMGIVGEDESAKQLRALLSSAGVCDQLLVDAVPTITKLRVLSMHQQLIRLDFEESPAASTKVDILTAMQAQLHGQNAIILSDYAKGALSQSVKMIAAAREADIPVLVDPKGNDFSIYKGASVITPNLSEFELVVGACSDVATIIERGQNLLADLNLDALLVTRSEQGMTLLQADQPVLHLPTQAQDVFDVTGAGDTVIATLSAAIAAGCSWPDAARLANAAAGLVVAKSGAAQVTLDELHAAVAPESIYSNGKSNGGAEAGCQDFVAANQKVLSESELLLRIQQDGSDGQTVVMTNGCFDVLHPGHVAYLEEARQLGYKLIVAVNDDASVRRLKGESRPINTLPARMAVLAGLAAVDYVVSFSEDTPERLITAALPNILVKGGDYRPEEVAGGSAVTAAGGRVEILQFVDGHSTSNTIKKIQQQT